MIQTLALQPFSFWVAILLLGIGGIYSLKKIPNGTGLPMLAVLGTVAAWYVGDVLYNDYPHNHALKFTAKTLAIAWWEVAWFVVAFLLLAPLLHQVLNRGRPRRGSRLFHMFQTGGEEPTFQKNLSGLLYGCIAVFLMLAIAAFLRLGTDIIYFFFPFLGYNADPWSRERMGSGIDALLSMANYLQIFAAASFGIIAALSKNPFTRAWALAGCLFTWPHFIFDRTRSAILAAVLPGILAWVFLRIRGSLLKKAVILMAFFILLSAWFGFVVKNRSSMSITTALQEKGFNIDSAEEAHHEGLNMFEELCWMNTFFDQGTFEPNWGKSCFAELVNPIPRSLWPGKPDMDLDYAIARGFGGGNAEQGGVYASVSTGMIGQGLENFGRFFGPPFIALLMGLWVCALARLDLQSNQIGSLPLYIFGLTLTFNLGRDITFITLYSFIFGWIVVFIINWRARKKTNEGVALSRVRNRSRRTRQRIDATIPIK